MDEKNSDDNQKDSYSQPKNDQAPSPRNDEVGPRSDTPPADKEGPQRQNDQEIAQPARPYWGLKWSEWLTLIFTGVIAGSAVTYTIYATRQWKAMSQQVDVMREQVTAATRAAEAAQSSVNIAEETLRTTKRFIHIEQRPYVGIKSIQMQDFMAGKKPVVVLSFENTGKTPATNATVEAVFLPTDKPLPEKPVWPRPPAPPSRNVLYPGIPWGTKLIAGGEIPEKGMEQINRGEVKIYVYGRVKYNDFFRDKSHITQFCVYYDVGRKGFSSCDKHNYAN